MSQTRYTEATTLTQIMNTELDTLADDDAVLTTTDLSNDASTERNTLANFAVTIGTQTARTTSPANLISLLIVPEGNSGGVYTDVEADMDVALSYIAKRQDGSDVTWGLDDSTADRELTAHGVLIPNSDYRVGILNRSSQALGGSGINYVYMSGTYSTTYA